MSKTTKKVRAQKISKEKKMNQAVETHLEEISGATDDDIFNFSEAILKKQSLDDSDNIKLKAYKKHIIKNKTKPVIETYPTLDDPEFNSKLFKKKEFLIDTVKPINASLTIDELTQKMCQFKLSPNQKFLKKYLSENTNYNGLILYHGTGVGKTCSSISIAEQFIDRLTKLNKKVIILLNPSIKANFMKNIFDIEKLKKGAVRDQCTRDKYLDLLNIDIDSITPEKYDSINARIKKLIKNTYSFYGYREFSNMVEKLENVDLPGVTDEMKNRIVKKRIQNMFSDTVMIIDEVHNIKETASSSDLKVLPPILKRVISNSTNMKLVLLSATPMYDNATEIVYLLNLLLMNDNRDTVAIKDFFTKNGGLKLGGHQKLQKISRGYISYLRGEHPIKFPKKLYPSIYGDPLLIRDFPKKDIKDNEVTPISNLEIIGCKMKGTQMTNYNKLEFNEDDNSFGSFNLLGMMTSNIIYPGPNTNKVADLTSKKGFDAIFEKTNKKYAFRDPKNENMFDLDTLSNYSAKIAQIIKNIKSNKEGIIFIYSQFIYAGILPLAMALEKHGFNNFTGNLLPNTPKNDAKYLLITGDNELSSNAYEKYLKIENENINGEKVKIIIGSESAAEGLDFKYIREVHIIDPWHHLNKLDQVVGRAIRNCSHIALPSEKRNVLVYHYASVKSDKPSKDTETIDLKLYRVAEDKSKKMSEVTNVLRNNAVDCELNKEDNVFNNPFYSNEMDIITSRNTKHTVTLNDIDESRECLYRNCNFKCVGTSTNKTLDESTYDYEVMADYYYDILDILKDLFRNKISLNIETIKKKFLETYNEEYLDLLYVNLDKIVNSEEYLDTKKNVLRMKDNVYYKIHETRKNLPINFYNLRIKTKKRKRLLNVSKVTYEAFHRKIRTKKIDNITKVEQKLNDIFEYKESLISLKPNISKFSADKITQLKSGLNKYKNEITYDYYNSKKQLIKYALETNQKKYLDMVDQNLLYMTRDVNPSHTDKKEIFGYKILENGKVNYYTTKHVLANKEQKRQIERVLFSRLENENVADDLIGYLVYKKDEIVLKIRDKLNEGKQGTQIKTGSICGNEGMKKGKIIDFLRYLTGDSELYKMDRKDLPGKPNLCLEVELLLRKYENEKKDNHRWFYNLEETVERELNKK